jgi:hypothetical protein
LIFNRGLQNKRPDPEVHYDAWNIADSHCDPENMDQD